MSVKCIYLHRDVTQKFFVIVILCDLDLVLTETKKYEKTKNFFVIVCYKEWQKRKLLTKIPISVKNFLFSFVIRSGLRPFLMVLTDLDLKPGIVYYFFT